MSSTDPALAPDHMTARDLIAHVRDSTDVDELAQLAVDESAREEPRTSVLEAIASRVNRLEQPAALSTVRNVSLESRDLADGRQIAPGADADDVDVNDPHNRALLDAEQLAEIPKEKS